jgi:aminopeptidase-like protein
MAVKVKPSANESLGLEMYDFISTMYPICRSITGNGVRETLKLIEKQIPIRTFEVPTGTKVFDWEIPKEWNIRDGYIKNQNGDKIIDFKKLNLHVLNYSIPVEGKMNLSALKEHIFTIPDNPDWVPYRTSYYAEKWGFCMSHNQLTSLKEVEYEVVIDSSLTQGSLTYGEYYIKGKSEKEVLITTHICHPSLCNDNLSGIAVCTYLADLINKSDPYYSYRFLFIPGTIGAIAWLAQNESILKNIKFGLVTSLLGIQSSFTYKRSRSGEERIDRIVEYVLKNENTDHEVIDFIPYGYDERQFCSPGINLPVGNLSRVPYGQYPEYHSSADNLQLISPEALYGSFELLNKIVLHIEADRKYLNLFPKGEPQLGKRGLYDNVGGQNDSKQIQMAFLWILNYSDGDHSLMDVAIRSKISVEILKQASVMLLEKGLLKEIE